MNCIVPIEETILAKASFSEDGEIVKKAVLEMARGCLTIGTPKEAEAAGECLKTIKELLDFVESSRVAFKAPIIEAGKDIDAKVKAWVEDIEAENVRLRKLMAEHIQSLEARQLAEVREHGIEVSNNRPAQGISGTDLPCYEILDEQKAYAANPQFFKLVPKINDIKAEIRKGTELPFIRTWWEKSVRTRKQKD